MVRIMSRNILCDSGVEYSSLSQEEWHGPWITLWRGWRVTCSVTSCDPQCPKPYGWLLLSSGFLCCQCCSQSREQHSKRQVGLVEGVFEGGVGVLDFNLLIFNNLRLRSRSSASPLLWLNNTKGQISTTSLSKVYHQVSMLSILAILKKICKPLWCRRSAIIHATGVNEYLKVQPSETLKIHQQK